MGKHSENADPESKLSIYSIPGAWGNRIEHQVSEDDFAGSVELMTLI
jgi:hypothetical protein